MPEAATEGGADLIVSGDRHLLRSIGRQVDTGDVVGTGRAGRLAATITGRVSLVWDTRTVSYRVEDPVEMDVESARVGLARRFLEVLAPATSRHFARWSGVGAEDAEKSLRALGDEAVVVSFILNRRGGFARTISAGGVHAESDPAAGRGRDVRRPPA